MLQFITHPSDRYSIPEEVQMVLEGGCKWVQLRLKDASDEEFRQIANEIIPLCQEHEAFLVFDDRVELAMEMHVHGVHLGPDDMPATKAREIMGAEAIIGVTAHNAEEILKFRGQDVDYVGVGPFRKTTTKKNLAPVLGISGYREIVASVREAGFSIPLVAIGGISCEDVTGILETGMNGIAVSSSIINSADPGKYTKEIIKLCKTY